MNRVIALLALPLLLSGCVKYQIRSDGVTRARLGETAVAGSVAVTPLAVVEDSRCPADVQCISAGRLVLSTRVGADSRELTLGQPVPAGGGTLLLEEVAPPRSSKGPSYPEDYRFGFRFTR